MDSQGTPGELLDRKGLGPRLATEAIKGYPAQLVRNFQASAARLPSFTLAARRLFDEPAGDFPFSPSLDDTAYEAIAEAVPEFAADIDAASGSVKTPFWSRQVVRNALAWLAVGVVLTAYVGAVFLPPPWDELVSRLLNGSGPAMIAYGAVLYGRHKNDESSMGH